VILAEEPLYVVRLVKQGLESYGWSICRDEQEIICSTESFTTVTEALWDASRAPATVVFDD
jgi:hypothetical protein